MGQTDQCRQTLRLGRSLGRALQQRSKDLDRLFQLAPLEEGKAKIQAQAGHLLIEDQRLAIQRHGLLVMFLPRLKEAQVGVGLSIRGVSLQDVPPCVLGFSILALFLQREGGVALIMCDR